LQVEELATIDDVKVKKLLLREVEALREDGFVEQFNVEQEGQLMLTYRLLKPYTTAALEKPGFVCSPAPQALFEHDIMYEIFRLVNLTGASGSTVRELSEKVDIPQKRLHRLLQQFLDSGLVKSFTEFEGRERRIRFIATNFVAGSEQFQSQQVAFDILKSEPDADEVNSAESSQTAPTKPAARARGKKAAAGAPEPPSPDTETLASLPSKAGTTKSRAKKAAIPPLKEASPTPDAMEIDGPLKDDDQKAPGVVVKKEKVAIKEEGNKGTTPTKSPAPAKTPISINAARRTARMLEKLQACKIIDASSLVEFIEVSEGSFYTIDRKTILRVAANLIEKGSVRTVQGSDKRTVRAPPPPRALPCSLSY